MKGTAASMSVMKRVSLIFRAKANKALDRMEDPRETLDYSYKQQVEMLTRVRRGVADVATSRKRVELQMNSLQKEITRRDTQARDALGKGREDLARRRCRTRPACIRNGARTGRASRSPRVQAADAGARGSGYDGLPAVRARRAARVV